MTSGVKDSLQPTKKGKSDGRWGCGENVEGGNGDHLYAVIDHPGYGYEFHSRLLDDAGAYMGEDGNGWIFCRVRLFTLH
jgi:hypothetical protein